MTNVQQPEMRRSEKDPLVQSAKGPGPAGHPRNRGSSKGDTGRPVPRGQTSPYGPTAEPTADDESDARA